MTWAQKYGYPIYMHNVSGIELRWQFHPVLGKILSAMGQCNEAYDQRLKGNQYQRPSRCPACYAVDGQPHRRIRP